MNDGTRANLGEQVRELQAEIDRLRGMVQDLTKQREDVIGERERIQSDHDRLVGHHVCFSTYEALKYFNLEYVRYASRLRV